MSPRVAVSESSAPRWSITDTWSAFMPGTDEATRKRIACTWPSDRLRPFWSVSITDAVAGLSSRTNRLGSGAARSEEHTSELQSLMRISYAVFCLQQQNQQYSLL